MTRKKILFVSNFSKLKTGFGRNARAVLTHLYDTGKYDIVEYCASPFRWSDINCENMPWKCHGCMPDSDKDFHDVVNDQSISRAAQYGSLFIDRIVKEERPDVIFFVEDIWAFNDWWNKPWWNKTTCVMWTTIDSLPIINIARDNAHKINPFWVWADFAREAMHELGHTHVETVHGTIDTDDFYPLSEGEKAEFRRKNNIEPDAIIFGFVFRNQLRKLVWRLVEAYAQFKKRNPGTKAKLLLHTYWEEGWQIKDYMKEFGVADEDVLSTYVCNRCTNVAIQPYKGQGIKCPACGEDGLVNPKTTFGCSEEDLNRVYNLMDAYVHPMTSGGLEIPIVEAMLAGLPVATVPYSCGTEFTSQDFVYPLEYIEYRELVSNFIKAQPTVESVVGFMQSVCGDEQWAGEDWKTNGQKGRDWALEEFSPKIIGGKIEDFIDARPFTTYDFDFDQGRYNDCYPFVSTSQIADNTEWLLDLYKGVFNMNENASSSNIQNWMGAFENNKTREEIHSEFLARAHQENARNVKLSFKDHFEENGKKRLAYVMPQSLGDCMLSLGILEEIRGVYPEDEWDMYIATGDQFTEIFEHLPYIKNIIPYDPRMDNFQWWEGCGENKGIVDIAFLPYLHTQRIPAYTHNGLDINTLQ